MRPCERLKLLTAFLPPSKQVVSCGGFWRRVGSHAGCGGNFEASLPAFGLSESFESPTGPQPGQNYGPTLAYLVFVTRPLTPDIALATSTRSGARLVPPTCHQLCKTLSVTSHVWHPTPTPLSLVQLRRATCGACEPGSCRHATKSHYFLGPQRGLTTFHCLRITTTLLLQRTLT